MTASNVAAAPTGKRLNVKTSKTRTMGDQPINFVRTEAELRGLIAQPHAISIQKQLTKLDRHCRNFIAHSPLVMIGSAGNGADVSPRGDAPGFVRVVDDHCLIIPERPGNRRLDTLTNILENPCIGLLFLIPGVVETLRVNGDAVLFRDEEILKRLKGNHPTPRIGMLVAVREAYLHCGKALIRSQLWEATNRVAPDGFPTLAEMLDDQVDLGMTVADADAVYQEQYRDTVNVRSRLPSEGR
jgi:PPOX class probable FMN-dependent enzyme